MRSTQCSVSQPFLELSFSSRYVHVVVPLALSVTPWKVIRCEHAPWSLNVRGVIGLDALAPPGREIPRTMMAASSAVTPAKASPARTCVEDLAVTKSGRSSLSTLSTRYAPSCL